MTYYELIDEWRNRLDECQRKLATGRALWPWLLEIQIRVLTFLVSRFEHDSSLARGARSGYETKSRMRLWVRDQPAESALPKDIPQIRGTLHAIRNAGSGQAEPGPLVAGLPDSYRVVAAMFATDDEASAFQRLLANEQIAANVIQVGRGCKVEVTVGDLTRTLELIESEQIRTRLGKPRRMDIKWTPAGIVICFPIGLLMVVILGTDRAPAAVVAFFGGHVLWVGFWPVHRSDPVREDSSPRLADSAEFSVNADVVGE